LGFGLFCFGGAAGLEATGRWIGSADGLMGTVLGSEDGFIGTRLGLVDELTGMGHG